VPVQPAAEGAEPRGSAGGQAPGQLRAGLLDAARQAFTHGLHVIAAISAGIAVGVAILDAVMLSRIESDSGHGKPASATGRHNQDEARKGAIG
jgi:MFS transporter, DHA2 family, multidrug resistance protein